MDRTAPPLRLAWQCMGSWVTSRRYGFIGHLAQTTRVPDTGPLPAQGEIVIKRIAQLLFSPSASLGNVWVRGSTRDGTGLSVTSHTHLGFLPQCPLIAQGAIVLLEDRSASFSRYSTSLGDIRLLSFAHIYRHLAQTTRVPDTVPPPLTMRDRPLKGCKAPPPSFRLARHGHLAHTTRFPGTVPPSLTMRDRPMIGCILPPSASLGTVTSHKQLGFPTLAPFPHRRDRH